MRTPKQCGVRKGIVSDAFHGKKIFIGGLGAGSYGVEILARCGPQKIVGVDLQKVEPANIPRTAYTWDDAQSARWKADALAVRIAAVNPLVETDFRIADITTLSRAQLDNLLDVDLIVAGTDSVAAQALLNEEAVRRQIPAVFVGLHACAAGGRVIWIMPGQTGCYRCIAPERFELEESDELHAEPACLIDSLLVEVVAMRVVLALLERGASSVMGRFFDAMSERNEIVVRADPTYEWGERLWNAMLADLHAHPQSHIYEEAVAKGGIDCRRA